MLYNRIIKQGTLNDPGSKPDPQWALPATVNWMRAIRILLKDQKVDFANASAYYRSHGKRNMDQLAENTAMEQLFLGLHHLSALEQFPSGTNASDYSRVGILAWYYGISNAASAMIAAQSGAFKEDHAGTAQLWDREIAARGLAMGPFGWRVSSLVEKSYKAEITAYKNGSSGDLHSAPSTTTEAIGAAATYLSGSAAWYSNRARDNIKTSKDFKELKVTNFRTKKAQELRDQQLSKKSIGFVHQASRYRGKANYREALFLAYGPGTEKRLTGFIDDLEAVLRGFLVMAGAFAKRKLGKELWSDFVVDVDEKRAFSTSAAAIWL